MCTRKLVISLCQPKQHCNDPCFCLFVLLRKGLKNLCINNKKHKTNACFSSEFISRYTDKTNTDNFQHAFFVQLQNQPCMMTKTLSFVRCSVTVKKMDGGEFCTDVHAIYTNAATQTGGQRDGMLSQMDMQTSCMQANPVREIKWML